MIIKSAHRSTPRTLTLAALTLVLCWTTTAMAQLNYVPNGTVEKVDPGNPAKPMYWEYSKWGVAANAGFTWKTETNGNRYLHTQVLSGTGTLPCSAGDAKWWTTSFLIPAGGGSYTVTDQYRSNVDSQLIVLANLTIGGNPIYVTAANLQAASSWTTVTKTVSLPTNTYSVRLLHKICTTGWLETDNFGLYQGIGTGTDAGVAADSGTWPGSDASGTGSGAQISIAFDDGWVSIYNTGLPIMKSMGIRGSHYIHAGYVDNLQKITYHMTSPMLIKFHKAGHEIGSHAWSSEWAENDDYLDATKLDNQLSWSLTRLKSYGFDIQGFAAPGGEGVDNQAVIAKVKSYYKYLRTIVQGVNTTPYDPYYLKARTILNTTTSTQIQGWINEAKAKNAWLILLYHRIRTPAVYETEVTPATFQSQLALIKASGLPIKPVGEVLGVWKSTAALPYDAGTAPVGDAGVADTGSSPVTDVGGSSWGDWYPTYNDAGTTSTDAATTTADAIYYSMPRPWPLDDDSRCSVSNSGDGLPTGTALVLMLILAAALRRRRG